MEHIVSANGQLIMNPAQKAGGIRTPRVSNPNNQRACREHKTLIINQILKRYPICNSR